MQLIDWSAQDIVETLTEALQRESGAIKYLQSWWSIPYISWPLEAQWQAGKLVRCLKEHTKDWAGRRAWLVDSGRVLVSRIDAADNEYKLAKDFVDDDVTIQLPGAAESSYNFPNVHIFQESSDASS